jgi:hypothetical protein
MSSLLSALDIVNSACAEIGADPLQDLDEDTIGGQAAALVYANVVDFNLGIEPFEFKFEIRQLSQIADASPLSGYTYLFNIPGPRSGPPRWLSDDLTDPERVYNRFRLIRGQVHADDSPLYASVPFRPDPMDWEPAFRKATVTALAAHLATALASDLKTRDRLLLQAYGTPQEQNRGGEMRNAIQNNAQATPSRGIDLDDNPLINSWRS